MAYLKPPAFTRHLANRKLKINVGVLDTKGR
jgi:hypothetical protein